jgi:hypothetical protein
MLEELNAVEFGCLPLISGDPQGGDRQSIEDIRATVAYMRAQIYRFNSLWKSHEYAATEKELSKEDKQKMLQLSLKIAEEGLFGPRRTS